MTDKTSLTAPARAAAPPPRVTVLLPVHNGERFVEEAARSVMGQTLRDLEILLVDDCSTDGTPAILGRLAAEDRRVRVERLPENLRLPRALNHGLGLATGSLVARMDADDVSEPERLAVQARYLDAHPEVLLVGASIRQIDEGGAVVRTTFRPRDPFAVRWLARFNMPLMHPTFMFRPRLPDGTAPRYDPAWTVTEDYDFLVRMLAHGEVANLPDVLLRYRMHGASVTKGAWATQQQQAKAIALRFSQGELPQPVLDGLEGFRRAYFDLERVEPAAILRGLRGMVAHDVSRAPARRAWLRRQASQMAQHAMQRSGRGRGDVVRAFLGPGRDFLPDVALRTLEVARLLPAGLRSDPSVG